MAQTLDMFELLLQKSFLITALTTWKYILLKDIPMRLQEEHSGIFTELYILQNFYLFPGRMPWMALGRGTQVMV